MREVRVVGIDAEGTRLLLDEVHPAMPVFATRSPGPSAPSDHWLTLDARLRAFVRRGLARQAGEPWLTPREVQARLRAGESVEAVAAAAGMPLERMEAYAAPVLSERARVLADALGAVMSRPHRGPSVLPLGESVERRLLGFADPGAEHEWHVRREPDGSWTVELRYRRNGRDRSARWRWDRFLRSLAPEDADAAAVGHVSADELVLPSRPVVTAEDPAQIPAENAAERAVRHDADTSVASSHGPGGGDPAVVRPGGGAATAEPSDEGAVADRPPDAIGPSSAAATAEPAAGHPDQAGRGAPVQATRRPPHGWADVLLGVGPRTAMTPTGAGKDEAGDEAGGAEPADLGAETPDAPPAPDAPDEPRRRAGAG